ncbi:MAG: 30S ribosomal protein S12 methylthiotransferase RimO [Desulforegulaceae bacterium]|nr:30S ribosomal protein S12 methylthiotransferase RimO [Desulforegulaceae bacterium]
MKTVYIESLGCPRNFADSEFLSGLLENNGYHLVLSPKDARFIIINTCGFIEDAVNESLDYIFEFSKLKKFGKCEFLIVAGCLAQRFKDELASELDEADFFVGTGGFSDIYKILSEIELKKGKTFFPDPLNQPLFTSSSPRIVSTFPFAYLKIAEGCARRCSFCIIPELKGRLRSRGVKDIVSEAESLVLSGIKEIVIVSQESTDYGRDFKTGEDLSLVLKEISSISRDTRIRFMYGHPLSISDKLIETVAENKNICSYFDIPIQHASEKLLKKMNRGYDLSFLRNLFKKIRQNISDAVLRTTIMTGFPGETEDDFVILSDFLDEIKFDHAGVFKYSEMDDLKSFAFENKVDPEKAEQRRIVLMEKQALISQEKNYEYLGKTLSVLIEKKDSEEFYAGRTMFQAPEVDGITYVDGKNLQPGDLVDVLITDAFDYDLAGNV